MQRWQVKENIRFHYNRVVSVFESILLTCCYPEFCLSTFLVGGEFSGWFVFAVKKVKLIFSFF